jgi:hypothetical protein
MAFGDGLRLRLLVDGVQQITTNTISCKIDGQNIPLESLEGLLGKSPGNGSVEISATASILSTGPEYDYWSAVQVGSYHDMQVPMGPKSYIGNGWFDTCEVSQSTGKAAELSFTWRGEFAPLR